VKLDVYGKSDALITKVNGVRTSRDYKYYGTVEYVYVCNYQPLPKETWYWYNPVTNVLKQTLFGQWVTSNKSCISSSTEISAIDGDFWYYPADGVLYYREDGAWKIVGGVARKLSRNLVLMWGENTPLDPIEPLIIYYAEVKIHMVTIFPWVVRVNPTIINLSSIIRYSIGDYMLHTLNKLDVLRYDFQQIVSLNSKTTLVYSDMAKVHSSVTLPYTDRVKVHNSIKIPYSAMSSVVGELKVPWRLLCDVNCTTLLVYDITNKNYVTNQLNLCYSINNEAIQTIDNNPALYFNDKPIAFITIDLSCDETSPYWISDVVLAYVEDFTALAVGDVLNLNFNSVDYSLIVDGKNLSRSDNAVTDYKITLISAGAVYDSPFSPTITSIYDTATLASTIVSDLLGTIDWQLPDWFVPVEQCQWVDETPMSIARKIVQAIGGLIESKPDGTFLCRKTYPINLPDYDTAYYLPLNDTDLLSVSETIAPQTIINRVDVYNTQIANQGIRDTLEFVVDTGTSTAGVVYGYPSPWRNVDLISTGDSAVVIVPKGDDTRTESETIEFKAGAASTKYPINRIISTTWNTTSLGAVVYNGNSLTATVAGESLLEISYEVVSKRWDVSGDKLTQFVLKSN
jgi:hypothetical protein